MPSLQTALPPDLANNVIRLYRECLRRAKYIGHRQHNTELIVDMVRQQFKKHMHETDPEKIQKLKDDAARGLINHMLHESESLSGRKFTKSSWSWRRTLLHLFWVCWIEFWQWRVIITSAARFLDFSGCGHLSYAKWNFSLVISFYYRFVLVSHNHLFWSLMNSAVTRFVIAVLVMKQKFNMWEMEFLL